MYYISSLCCSSKFSNVYFPTVTKPSRYVAAVCQCSGGALHCQGALMLNLNKDRDPPPHTHTHIHTHTHSLTIYKESYLGSAMGDQDDGIAIEHNIKMTL